MWHCHVCVVLVLVSLMFAWKPTLCQWWFDILPTSDFGDVIQNIHIPYLHYLRYIVLYLHRCLDSVSHWKHWRVYKIMFLLNHSETSKYLWTRWGKRRALHLSNSKPKNKLKLPFHYQVHLWLIAKSRSNFLVTPSPGVICLVQQKN